MPFSYGLLQPYNTVEMLAMTGTKLIAGSKLLATPQNMFESTVNYQHVGSLRTTTMIGSHAVRSCCYCSIISSMLWLLKKVEKRGAKPEEKGYFRSEIIKRNKMLQLQ